MPAVKDLPQRDITDNSNTQFAILGIWAAGRHAVPMEKTLALLVKRTWLKALCWVLVIGRTRWLMTHFTSPWRYWPIHCCGARSTR